MFVLGNRIREVLDEQGMTVTSFANELGCCRENAHKLLNKSSMDTQTLLRICRILNHNFFAEISEQMDLD